MVCTFNVGFQKDYKSCFFLLVDLAGLIDTLLHRCQLEGSYCDCLSRGDKGDTEKVLQYIIADLNSSITFIVLFGQEKPLRK